MAVCFGANAEAACNVPALAAALNIGQAICPAVIDGSVANSVATTFGSQFIGVQVPYVSGSQGNATTGYGVWSRSFAMVESTRPSTTLSSTSGSYTTSNSITTNSQAFQLGADIAQFDIGSSGWAAYGGVTAGSLWSQPQVGSDGSYHYDVPFVGLYSVLTNGSFALQSTVLRGFYASSMTSSGFALSNYSNSGDAFNFSSTASYRFVVNSFGIEPTAGISLTDLSVHSFGVGSVGGVVPSGNMAFSRVYSDLANVGLRISHSYDFDKFSISPYVAVAVWDEFGPKSVATYTTPAILPTTTVYDAGSKLGAYGQYSVGGSFQVHDSGWSGYFRSDVKLGDNIRALVVSSGLRYSF
jgi:hypothetical protein